jgi:hypothetical protein
VSNRQPGTIRIEPYVWDRGQPGAVPGIAVKTIRGFVYAHLTPDEARHTADRLHDLADQIEQETTA